MPTAATNESQPSPSHNPFLPRHVAIIMDGNGRWAQQRHLPRLFGHQAGVRNMHRIVRSAVNHGVSMLTVYAFSTENWGRPPIEVDGLMQIFADVSQRETRNLHRNGVKIVHIGSLDNVPKAQKQAIEQAVELTKANSKLQLNVAFNYGGRAEIVEAVRAVLRANPDPLNVDESTIAQHLYTAGMPDPDLVIRTAGELRLSNFLIWQASYAEYYFSEKMWPDFDESEFERALEAFGSRQRKFGRV